MSEDYVTMAKGALEHGQYYCASNEVDTNYLRSIACSLLAIIERLDGLMPQTTYIATIPGHTSNISYACACKCGKQKTDGAST